MTGIPDRATLPPVRPSASLVIRPFEKSDYRHWLPLWRANGLNRVAQDVTNQTWQRLCNADSAVCGFGAFTDDGTLAGIIHYILHPATGTLAPVCYMQDLYVAESLRRRGVARALINRLHLEGRNKGWARIYWLAKQDNIPAQNLYKTLGITLDFTLHILPTER